MSRLISISLPPANEKQVAEIQKWLEKKLSDPKDLVLYAAKQKCWICSTEGGYTKEEIETALKSALNAATLNVNIGELKIQVALTKALASPEAIADSAKNALIASWTSIFALLGPPGLLIGGIIGPLLKALPPGDPSKHTTHA